jgi:hypothetical protein
VLCWFLGLRNVLNDPSGTRRASSEQLSRRLLPPPRWRAPSGGVRSGRAAAWPVQWPGRKRWASSPPAALALRPPWSAPALRCARQGAGHASTAATSRDRRWRFGPRAAGRRARSRSLALTSRPAAPVALLPAAGSVKARRSRGPRHSPRRVGEAEGARGPQGPLGRCALSPCGSFTPLCSPSTDGGGIAPPVGLRSRRRRPLPACGAPLCPRLVNSARCAPCASRAAPCAYDSRPPFRSFVAALRPRAARLALLASCAA